MRVLCTVYGSESHARAMMPIAEGLAAAGHEVVIATWEMHLPIFLGKPFRVEAVLPHLSESFGSLFAELSEYQGPPPNRAVMITLSAGPHVTKAYQGVLTLAEEVRPDIIVRDGSELTGVLVGETLGIPHVSVPSGHGNTLDAAGVVAPLNARRTELGLPTQDDPMAIYRYGRIDCMPTRYSFSEFGSPVPMSYRQPLNVSGDQRLPESIASLSGDKPLVVGAIGTALKLVKMMAGDQADQAAEQFEPPLQALAEGLSEVDCHAVISTAGFPVDRAKVGPNVHLFDWIPQQLLLQCGQLFVTHSGYNSIREAVSAGIPMAGLPIFGDQEFHADQVQRLNLGRRITEPTAENVAKVCTEVLNSTEIAGEVRRAHREMLGLPGVEAVVQHLENLVQ